MKFELFQRQPTAADYEPRLARVHRQLRDIRRQARGAELCRGDPEGVRGQLADARCVYNALSDIKPEVENVIKMGRKIVLSSSTEEEDEYNDGNGDEARKELTAKIDSLKEEFNEIGGQV